MDYICFLTGIKNTSDRLNERDEAPGKVEGKQLFIGEREK